MIEEDADRILGTAAEDAIQAGAGLRGRALYEMAPRADDAIGDRDHGLDIQ
jgi:hypothetical protein